MYTCFPNCTWVLSRCQDPCRLSATTGASMLKQILVYTNFKLYIVCLLFTRRHRQLMQGCPHQISSRSVLGCLIEVSMVLTTTSKKTTINFYGRPQHANVLGKSLHERSVVYFKAGCFPKIYFAQSTQLNFTVIL